MALARHTEAALVESRLRRDGRSTLRADSVRTAACLPPGSYVEVRPVDPALARPGDLLAYEYAGDVYCRRLLRRAGKLLILKGDTEPWADPPVIAQQVIGRVSAYITPDARMVSLNSRRGLRLGRWRARMSYLIGVLNRIVRFARYVGDWHRHIRLAGE